MNIKDMSKKKKPKAMITYEMLCLIEQAKKAKK